MYNTSPEYRLEVVRYYLHHGSFRETARTFHVSYRSVFKWVDRYRKGGSQGVLNGYRRPWNRAARDLEENVVKLKEQEPSLTLTAARRLLKAEGVEISCKGIWGIWKRYGYAGFTQEKLTNDWTSYCPWSKEAEKKCRSARILFSAGDPKGAADILNSIPALPENELLLKLPDGDLNARRRAEKMDLALGKISLSDYLRKAPALFRELKKRNLLYSALRVGIKEVIALEWSGNVEQQLRRIGELSTMLEAGGFAGSSREGSREERGSYLLFEPRFTLLISRGIALSSLMRIREGRQTARAAARLLNRRQRRSPYLLGDLAVLYSSLEEYRLAEKLLSKSIDGVDEDTAKKLRAEQAFVSFMKADYRKAAALGKSAQFGEWEGSQLFRIFQSALALLRGMPQRAISLCLDILSSMEGEELSFGLFYTYFTLANARCALGEREKAERILRRLLPYLEKNRMIRELYIVRILLSGSDCSSDIALLGRCAGGGAGELPTVRMALLLKDGRYREALSLARKKGILSYFYRYVLFFPETVIGLLDRGKSTSLPRSVLRLPLFSKEAPVYHLNFLGKAVLYRNGQYLRQRLPPKDLAFFIHLALRAGEPGKELPLDDLYANFWGHTKYPSRNLSHLLVRIRKALRIPSHLLGVDPNLHGGVLLNRGIYLTTDYDEWNQGIAQANAFLRADEWEFASREFRHVFSLLRGEPFRRMYDTWSEDTRTRIIFGVRSAWREFARDCVKQGDQVLAESLSAGLSGRFSPGLS